MSAEHILVRRSVGSPEARHKMILVPVDNRDDAALEKIPLSEVVAVRLIRNRSLQQHRLFRGILDHVARASIFETDDCLLAWLKIKLGRFNPVPMPNGKFIAAPHSTSFDEMNQAEFQTFFDDALRLICTEVIPGTDRDSLIDEVQAMLGVAQNPVDNPPDRSPAAMANAPVPQAGPESAPSSFVVAPVRAKRRGYDWNATKDALLARAEQIGWPPHFTVFRAENARTIDCIRNANRGMWNDLNFSLSEMEGKLRDRGAKE